MTNEEIKQSLLQETHVKVKGLTGTYRINSVVYRKSGNVIKPSAELYDGTNCVLYAGIQDIEKE